MAGEYFTGGYPPVAFHFAVSIGNGAVADASFTEVSGIGTEMQMESLTEGGENRFVWQLPTGTKHGNLQLKRGVANQTSPLMKWCKSTLEGELATPLRLQVVIVQLLGASGEVLRAWQFNDAYPVKWSVDGFSSTKNDVAIEQIALAYSYSQRTV
nr:phage tail protein [uncultured Duganella sp.]